MLENLSNFGRYFTVRPFALVKNSAWEFSGSGSFLGLWSRSRKPSRKFLEKILKFFAKKC